MSLALKRLLALLLNLSLLALVGGIVGFKLGAPAVGTWIGALLGAAWAGWRDACRAVRLVDWMRGNMEAQAPRDGELWGELAYRTERALLHSEQRTQLERRRREEFLDAIEASPNGVLLLDADEQIVWLSQVAAVHLGLDPVRDLGQRITNLVRAPAFVAALQSGSTEPLLMMSGSLPAQLSLSVLVRSYGTVGQRLVLTQDVTERQRNEAMRRDFVANVSHEIRTPLTVLAGFVETMATLPLGAEDRERMLQLMTQQTRRMQTLVTDLLTLARLEGSPQPAPDDWHPAAELLEQVGVEVAALSRGRHLIRHPDASDEAVASVEIAGNASELLSAMTNLASNAVRYTPEEGRITVVWALRPGGGALFEVCDSGIGIARDHLPRLTERFYRVDGSRSRETGGTGLGLSIVKHVVQRHGAELSIDSQPGQGSTFCILFPASRIRVRRPVAASPQLLRL
ncbi:MAG: phosphate regulon sensor histidine kinase PhoR [Pseudomonadota bacterium]|jgi:two-component system phosphate regulon sensor histidine kinase PhoR|nr:two-component system, OmpR family, phosphate regulon sensor histidine kinase PhoR [Pseudomonadota bacterium]